MCRQFYRYCRDCHEPFPMSEPGMREFCEAFETTLAIKPLLKRCPGIEVQVIRAPSGHGSKVCEPCSKRNRNQQRKRENAQKRARRAKLKKEKMTQGIDNQKNVLWNPPTAWRPSFVDAQTVTLHSPFAKRKTRPRGPNIVGMRSTTQSQRQYGLHSSISMATVAQRHVNVTQLEHKAYLESRGAFTTTTSNVLQPQEHDYDKIATEVRNDTNLHQQYDKIEPQYLPTPKSDVPLPTTELDLPLRTPISEAPLPATKPELYQKHQTPPVGLGITLIPNDIKQEQSHTETSFFNESYFRMELNEWSTFFDDDGGPDNAKEL